MVWHCNEISTKGGEDRARRLLLFPSRVLTRSGSADPELTVSAFSTSSFALPLCWLRPLTPVTYLGKLLEIH